jgi:hypothetical protein
MAVVDTQRISNYVFEGGELALMRGASRLLADCTEQRWPKLILRGRKIFCGGGNALALFKSRPDAHAFCMRAVSALTNCTSSATASWHVEEAGDGEEFGDWRDRAFRGLHAMRNSGGVSEASVGNPYTRFCDKCGTRNAGHRWRDGSNVTWICGSCRKKRGIRRAFWFSWFLDDTKGTAQDSPKPAADLSQIGECSHPSGYNAFIHLDINQLGRRLQRTRDPDEFIRLSSAVKQSTQSGVVTGLKLSVKPCLSGADKILPFEIFLIGGDEALVVTPAHLAVAFVEKFLIEFVRTFRTFNCGDPPGVSAGVVFAHSRFPVRAAADTAHDGAPLVLGFFQHILGR